MCGIVGIRRFDGAPVDRELIETMTDTLHHRGPDGSGTWFGQSVGFGHRRLSIIDLTGSHQPMSAPDSALHVCFNGEIFNYAQLRAEHDYPYATAGDTEVLLAMFRAHGADGVRRLRGQFAYAIYDSGTGDLWLFRDPTGVLPLYYYIDERLIAFGSEVKSILPAVPGGPRLDSHQLATYLQRRAVPAPATLFAGVRKVRPGHLVRVTAAGEITEEQYWSPPDPADVLDDTDDALIDRIDAQLRDAVADSLVADVPVGAYLSGGVDSSLIVATAARQVAPIPLATFCAEFGDARFDESPYAQAVADLFATNHHVVRVRAEDFADLWQDLTWHRDGPISEPADVAVFRLAQEARRHVKVVLSGEGSDELFGGYPKYAYAGLTARELPLSGLWRSAAAMTERAVPGRANRLRIALRAQTAGSGPDRLASWFAPFTEYECERLLGHAVPGPAIPVPARDAVDLMARMDLAAWLPDNLLERGDRMSMAASLELRPPFLDRRLVETAFRLPSRVKVRGRETKWILKQVARRHLPDTIWRRPKVGFRVPLDSWFRSGLRDRTHDLLLGPDSFVADVLDPGEVARLVADHERHRRNEEIRIWTLLSLEVWGRTFLRGGVDVTSRAPAQPAFSPE